MFVETVEIFLDATPKEMNVEALEKSILDIREVNALSHLHIWSIDGQENVLTVTVSIKEKDPQIQEKVKEKIRLLMGPYNTTHSTIEIIVDEEGLLTKK
jgi:cobalt-zinc-cadmium efflux system protein